MEKATRWLLVRWLNGDLHLEVIRYVVLPYALPLVLLVLAGLTGLHRLREVWYWFFLPALGLHLLLLARSVTRPDLHDRVPIAIRETDVHENEERLRAGFADVTSKQGLQALDDLVREYQRLTSVIERGRDTGFLFLRQLPALSMTLYRQGLSVLQDALDLSQALADGSRIEANIAALEEEVRTLTQLGQQEERIKLRKERLAGLNDLLLLAREKQIAVETLLNQANRCSESLQRARMELPGLRTDASLESVGVIIDVMRLTISQAKDVQSELRNLEASW